MATDWDEYEPVATAEKPAAGVDWSEFEAEAAPKVDPEAGIKRYPSPAPGVPGLPIPDELGRLSPEDQAEYARTWQAMLPENPVTTMTRLGKAGVGALADVGTAGDRNEGEGMMPNAAAGFNLEKQPIQKTMETPGMPQSIKFPYKIASGLLETAPKLAAVMASGPASPLTAGYVFGTDEQGNFHPADAAVATALPFVGKYSGEIVGALAKKFGVSAAEALHIWKAAGALTGAAAYLATIDESQIENLPPEQRNQARIDSLAGLIGQSVLGPMGVEKKPGTMLPKARAAAEGVAGDVQGPLATGELLQPPRGAGSPRPLVSRDDLEGGSKASMQKIMDKFGVNRDRAAQMRQEGLEHWALNAKLPAEVPGTAAEPGRNMSVTDEVRAKGADTIAKVKALFPGVQMSNEQARVFRDAAFPKAAAADTGLPAWWGNLEPEGKPGEPAVPIPGDVAGTAENPADVAASNDAAERRIMQRHLADAQNQFDQAVQSGDEHAARAAGLEVMRIQRVLFAPERSSKPPIRPKPPTPNAPRSAFPVEVPETAPEAERGQTVIQEIRAKGADTLNKIKALYPDRQLSNEEARVLRNQAFPPGEARATQPEDLRGGGPDDENEQTDLPPEDGGETGGVPIPPLPKGPADQGGAAAAVPPAAGRFKVGDKVAKAGSFSIQRGEIVKRADGTLGVQLPGHNFIAPLSEGWKFNEEVQPAKTGPGPFTRERFNDLIENPQHIPQEMQDRGMDLIQRLRKAIADRNLDPETAETNQLPETGFIGRITGSLTRVGRQNLSIARGYKRGNPKTASDAVDQVNEVFKQAEEFLGKKPGTPAAASGELPAPQPEHLTGKLARGGNSPKPALSPDYYRSLGNRIYDPATWVQWVRQMGRMGVYKQESTYQLGLFIRQLGGENGNRVIDALEEAREIINEKSKAARDAVEAEPDPEKKMAIMTGEDFSLGMQVQFPREAWEAAMDTGSSVGYVPKELAPPIKRRGAAEAPKGRPEPGEKPNLETQPPPDVNGIPQPLTPEQIAHNRAEHDRFHPYDVGLRRAVREAWERSPKNDHGGRTDPFRYQYYLTTLQIGDLPLDRMVDQYLSDTKGEKLGKEISSAERGKLLQNLQARIQMMNQAKKLGIKYHDPLKIEDLKRLVSNIEAANDTAHRLSRDNFFRKHGQWPMNTPERGESPQGPGPAPGAPNPDDLLPDWVKDKGGQMLPNGHYESPPMPKGSLGLLADAMKAAGWEPGEIKQSGQLSHEFTQTFKKAGTPEAQPQSLVPSWSDRLERAKDRGWTQEQMDALSKSEQMRGPWSEGFGPKDKRIPDNQADIHDLFANKSKEEVQKLLAEYLPADNAKIRRANIRRLRRQGGIGIQWNTRFEDIVDRTHRWAREVLGAAHKLDALMNSLQDEIESAKPEEFSPNENDKEGWGRRIGMESPLHDRIMHILNTEFPELGINAMERAVIGAFEHGYKDMLGTKRKKLSKAAVNADEPAPEPEWLGKPLKEWEKLDVSKLHFTDRARLARSLGVTNGPKAIREALQKRIAEIRAKPPQPKAGAEPITPVEAAPDAEPKDWTMPIKRNENAETVAMVKGPQPKGVNAMDLKVQPNGDGTWSVSTSIMLSRGGKGGPFYGYYPSRAKALEQGAIKILNHITEQEGRSDWNPSAKDRKHVEEIRAALKPFLAPAKESHSATTEPRTAPVVSREEIGDRPGAKVSQTVQMAEGGTAKVGDGIQVDGKDWRGGGEIVAINPDGSAQVKVHTDDGRNRDKRINQIIKVSAEDLATGELRQTAEEIKAGSVLTGLSQELMRLGDEAGLTRGELVSRVKRLAKENNLRDWPHAKSPEDYHALIAALKKNLGKRDQPRFPNEDEPLGSHEGTDVNVLDVPQQKKNLAAQRAHLQRLLMRLEMRRLDDDTPSEIAERDDEREQQLRERLGEIEEQMLTGKGPKPKTPPKLDRDQLRAVSDAEFEDHLVKNRTWSDGTPMSLESRVAMRERAREWADFIAGRASEPPERPALDAMFENDQDEAARKPKTAAQPKTVKAPEPASKPAAKGNWLESLADTVKESVYQAMREIRQRADSYGEEERRLRPPQGKIAAGAAGFDSFMQSEARNTFLSELGKGKTPEEAEREAKQWARDAVGIHNKQRPKDINWQRDGGTADTVIETARRQIEQAQKAVPAPKAEQPVDENDVDAALEEQDQAGDEQTDETPGPAAEKFTGDYTNLDARLEAARAKVIEAQKAHMAAMEAESKAEAEWEKTKGAPLGDRESHRLYNAKIEARAATSKADAAVKEAEGNASLARYDRMVAEYRGKPEPEGEQQITSKMLKAQKDSLMAQLAEAIKAAPEESSDKDKITIKVPGDGEFTLTNNKASLKQFRDGAAKGFPSTANGPGGPGLASVNAKAAPKLGTPTGTDLGKIAGDFTSSDENRAVLHNAYADGTQIVATDGRQLIRIVTDEAPGTPAKPVHVGPDGKVNAKATSENNFPNYAQVRDNNAELVYGGMDTGDLFHIVRQAEVFRNTTVEDRSKRSGYSLKVVVNPDRSLGGSMDINGEQFEHNIKPGALSIGNFNPDYLLNAMSAARKLGNKTVDVSVSGDDGPVLFTGKNHESILMPMRGEKLPSGEYPPVRDTPSAFNRVAGRRDHPKLGPGLPPMEHPEMRRAYTFGTDSGNFQVQLENGHFTLKREEAAGYRDAKGHAVTEFKHAGDMALNDWPEGEKSQFDAAKKLAGEKIKGGDRTSAGKIRDQMNNLVKEREKWIEEGKRREAMAANKGPGMIGMGGAVQGELPNLPTIEDQISGTLEPQSPPEESDATAEPVLRNWRQLLDDQVERFKGWAGGLAGKTFPRTTAKSKRLGELAARWISSAIAAKPMAEVFAADVIGDSGVDRVHLGAALTEDNLRSIKQAFEDKADEAENRDEIIEHYREDLGNLAEAVQDKDPVAMREASKIRKEISRLSKLTDEDAARFRMQASKVKSFVGTEGFPFHTEDELQAFFDDARVKQVIARHKDLWHSVIEPQYKNAMMLDPEMELPSRGQQTGARINLRAVIEGESSRNAVTTANRGNLLNTFRRKSPFGVQAKGTGEAYHIDYHDLIENTFRKQLEIANKNAFETALVEAGQAVIAGPGRVIKIDGRVVPKDAQFPLKRRTIINQGGGSVNQDKKLYINPRLAEEYAIGANVDRKPPSGAVQLVNKVLNATALAGLTDATTHIVNQVSTLATLPGASGKLLHDSMLSAVPGRADIWVALGRALVGGFKDNRAQLASLAEIGALREEHEPSGLSRLPVFKQISQGVHWMDKTTRLALDNAYKRLAQDGIVENSETARREFINQIGQYNKRAQGRYTRLFRDTGLGPFVTAGKTFNALGVRGITLNPGVKATSYASAAALKANMALKLVGTLATVGIINYLLTKDKGGGVMGRPGIPIGDIDLGSNDANGRPNRLSVFSMIGPGRGLRVTGVRGFLQSKLQGLPTGTAAAAGIRDVANSAISPWAGPPVKAGMLFLTGYPTAINVGRQSQVVPPGENQFVQNAKEAALQASPVVAGIEKANQPGGNWADAVKSQLPRFLPQAGKSPEMMRDYPGIVRRAQASAFIEDVIARARKLEPGDRRQYLYDSLGKLANVQDRATALKQFRYRKVL